MTDARTLGAAATARPWEQYGASSHQMRLRGAYTEALDGAREALRAYDADKGAGA